MPARTPTPPRRVPADGTVALLPRLPERKVAHVLLVVLVRRAARTRSLVVEVDVRELAVAGELRDGEVDAAVVALVRDPLLDKLLDERDHLGDVVGGGRIDFRRLYVELLQVGEERVLVGLRVVGERHAGGVRAADRLVVHVSEVHHLPDLHAVELDHAAQDVLERVRAEVADVGEIVDRRPARVEADGVVRERLKRLDAAGQRVVDLHFHGGYSTITSPPPSKPYSHSIVAGGLEEMSYTTRLIPRTSLMMRLDIRARVS